MTCNDMDAVINSRSGGPAPPPKAAEHIAVCLRCRQVMRLLDEGPKIRRPSERQVKSIHASVLRALEPVRPLASPGVFLVAFAGIFLAVAILGFIQVHDYGWRVLSLLQKMVVFTSLALGAGALALSMARQMRPGSRYSVSPNLLPIAIFFLLAASIAAVFQGREESAFVLRGLFCLRLGLKYAVPGGLLSWLVLRRGVILAPKLMGATAGGFAGLIGITVLEVHCPNLNLYHILVWHLSALVTSALGGAMLGAAVEVVGRWRYRRTLGPGA
jgi:hypothetical protein